MSIRVRSGRRRYLREVLLDLQDALDAQIFNLDRAQYLRRTNQFSETQSFGGERARIWATAARATIVPLQAPN